MQMHLIKGSYKFIQKPLKYIFNLSFKYREFPNKPKIARVALIFKSGDEILFTNYRSISILPCFSNILEGIMYFVITYNNFVIKSNNILYKKQFEFQLN